MTPGTPSTYQWSKPGWGTFLVGLAIVGLFGALVWRAHTPTEPRTYVQDTIHTLEFDG